jgi:hypothetical protein
LLLCSSHLPLGVPNYLAIIIIINYTPAINIQFTSSKLTAAMRGSLSGCKFDADTSVYSAKPKKQKTAEKEYISKHKRVSKSSKGKKGIAHTSSSSRHRIQPLSYGLFSLEVLLVSISQGFFCFLRLS